MLFAYLTIMAQPFAKAFYDSPAWQRCRKAYIEHVFGLCERCGKPGLILHHKILLTPENIDNPDVTLNFDNLEFVCLECHNQIHEGSSEPAVPAGFIITESGDFVPAGYPPLKKASHNVI